MSFYHLSKEKALEAGKRFDSLFKVTAQLEPYNGWVIVLYPHDEEYLKYPLISVLEHAVICVPSKFLAKYPEDRKVPPKIEATDRRKPPSAPPKAPPPPPPPPGASPVLSKAPPPPPPPPSH